MELTAAVLTVCVDRMLQRELQLQLQRSTFWTDGTTVLKYISNETKRFHTFVANRTAVIIVASDVEQWRYIGSKVNPADEASRGMKVDDFLASKMWIHGPEFLSKPEEEWPKPDVEFCVISSDDPEVKRDPVVSCITKDTENHTNYLINYFSTWMKLKTTVAWFMRLKELLKQLTQKRKEIHAFICISENDSEKQRTTLEKRMHTFKTTVSRQGLCPEDYGQQDSILRVGGRLIRAVIPEETEHPVIPSKDLYISTRILYRIHQQLGKNTG